eukprot:TRINITY_DN4700_c0_g1_i1.p1 TRINITY_DN4700_c0_g1~~TRINITY_DN4700_c0_g1_i1.p1  ORF type:complete len:161 (+),score=33.94 TRINITY_DN4700_c0_g1_i1:619-1101(+)
MGKRSPLYYMAVACNGGLAAGLVYDFQNQHKLRLARGEWQPLQAATRIVNLLNPYQPELGTEDLAQYDGVDGRKLYFSAGGKVYDATNSDSFRAAYPQYAGNDATFSLARLSLESRDVGRTDWDSLTTEDLVVMDDWLAYFDQTLLCVGTLRDWRRPSEN